MGPPERASGRPATPTAGPAQSQNTNSGYHNRGIRPRAQAEHRLRPRQIDIEPVQAAVAELRAHTGGVKAADFWRVFRAKYPAESGELLDGLAYLAIIEASLFADRPATMSRLAELTCWWLWREGVE